MNRARFRRLVQRALDSLPAEVDTYMENVAVVVEREPTPADRQDAHLGDREELFGLYVGVPRPARSDYHMTLPDRIVIYQGPIERRFHPRDIPEEVARTVLHEIAHHFGLDDHEVDRIGLG